MIYAGIRSLDILFLDDNMFRQVIMSWNSDIVIKFVNFLYVMEWQPHLTLSLIFGMDRSIYLICSFVAYVCRCAGDKNIGCVQIHCHHGNQLW